MKGLAVIDLSNTQICDDGFFRQLLHRVTAKTVLSIYGIKDCGGQVSYAFR